MNMLIWMRVESLVTHRELEPLQSIVLPAVTICKCCIWYNLRTLYLVYKLNCIAHDLISLYTYCYIKNKKNIEIVMRSRDSRSAKSIETR